MGRPLRSRSETQTASASPICSPTRRRGLSEENGFWKTICRRTSSRGRAPRVSGLTSRPSKRTVPDRGATIPTAARARVDLPQPDSPTSPTIAPRSISRLAPATARTGSSPAALVLHDDVGELEGAQRRPAGRSGSTGQASARPFTGTSGGIASLHDARVPAARMERAAGGMRRGVGGAPWIAMSGVAAASGWGNASRSPRVYGCRGWPSTAVRLPASTTRPA